MIDQANHLRKLVMQAAGQPADDGAARGAMVLVGGGKGGVGTTTVAVNLAVAAAQGGARTVLIDGDPNGGDVQSLCRLQQRYTIADVLSARRTLGEALQPGPAGVLVLAGAWAGADLADAGDAGHARLLDQIETLGKRVDLVVIDGGNGRHAFTRRLWQTCGEVLLVASPESNAVLDTYAALKVGIDPTRRPMVRLLVNLCDDQQSALDVHERIARSARRFLGLELKHWHWLAYDRRVFSAGHEGVPFVLAEPGGETSRTLMAIAQSMENTQDTSTSEAAAEVFDRTAGQGARSFQNQLISARKNADSHEDRSHLARC